MIRPGQQAAPAARAIAFDATRVALRATLLLATLLVLLFATQAAWAADGRALVVSGIVQLERPPGSTPTTVIAGTEFERGDLIRTGPNGRVQIRFTDGSIIALQPDTTFRIDEYRFDSGGQRGFFFLLRGALRTITGAIGKRDHDDYRMSTPTATIGVRGTEYVAEQTACDPRCSPGTSPGLRVAVTQGRIVVATRAGAIEVAAGQSAAAEDADSAPHSTEQGPVLPPISYVPETEREPTRVAQSGQSGQSGGMSGSADASTGSADASTDSTGGASAGAAGSVGSSAGSTEAGIPGSPQTGSGGEPAPIDIVLAGYAPSPATPGSSGGNANGGDPLDEEDPLAPGASVSPNEKRDDSGGLAAIPGGPGAGDPGSGGPGSGDPGSGNPGTGDPGSGGPGSGDPGSGDPGSGDPGSGDPGSGDPGSGDPGSGDPGSGDPGSGDPGSGDPGSGDPGSGDPGSGDPGSGDPGSGDPGSDPPPLEPGDSEIGTGRGVYLRQVPFANWLGLFQLDSRVTLDDTMAVQSIGLCPNLFCLSRGSARVAEGGSDPYTSWGRWTDGTVVMRVLFLPFPTQLSANQGMHYLAGVPSATVPTQGVFGYSLIGATFPTMSDGRAAPGRFSGAAGVAFAPGQAARVGLQGLVTIGAGTYGFETAGGAANPGSSALVANGPGHTFSGMLDVTPGGAGPLPCAGGCQANVEGGLFGPNAARLGLSYEIQGSGGGSRISGVGVFAQQPAQP